MNKLGSLALAAALIGLPVQGIAAYQGADVKDGGSISGTVKFKGTAPAPKKVDVTKDKEVCGKTAKTDESLIVSNGNLVNAVITITDINSGKKMDVKKVTLDQKDCDYHPHVLAFPAGSAVEIVNPDGILHNIHSYSKVNTSFNIRGEPIVCSPDDAYRCFMRTEMDYLAIGNFLLSKQDQPEQGPIDCSLHREYEPD